MKKHLRMRTLIANGAFGMIRVVFFCRTVNDVND